MTTFDRVAYIKALSNKDLDICIKNVNEALKSMKTQTNQNDMESSISFFKIYLKDLRKERAERIGK